MLFANKEHDMGKNNIKLRIYPNKEQSDIFKNVFACQKSILIEALAITENKLEHTIKSNKLNKLNKLNKSKNVMNINNLDNIEKTERKNPIITHAKIRNQNYQNYQKIHNNDKNKKYSENDFKLNSNKNNDVNSLNKSNNINNEKIESNEILIKKLNQIKNFRYSLMSPDDFENKNKKSNQQAYLYFHKYTSTDQFISKKHVLSETKNKVLSVMNMENTHDKSRILMNLKIPNYFIISDLKSISFDLKKKIVSLPNLDEMKISVSNQDKIYLLNMIEMIKSHLFDMENTSVLYLISIKESAENLYYLQIQKINLTNNPIKEKEIFTIDELANNKNHKNKLNKLEKNIKKIKREKRSYSKKKDNSNNKQKQATKIAKLNRKIRNQKSVIVRSYMDKYNKQT